MHPAIKQLFAHYPLARENESALERLLHQLPWAPTFALPAENDTAMPRPSLLTPNGAPIEFTFSSQDHCCRLTVEPSHADAPRHHKWLAVANILGQSTIRHLPPLQQTLRAAIGQKFSVWLGWRSEYSGATKDKTPLDLPERYRYKIYQEVTPAMQAAVAQALATAYPHIPKTITLTPQIIGTTTCGTTEFYCHFRQASAHQLHDLFLACGYAAELPAVLNALGLISAHSRTTLFRQLQLGVSLRRQVLTLFVAARTLAHSDQALRRRLLQLSRDIDKPLFAYTNATQALENTYPSNTIHGMVGITMTPAGMHLSAGIRPFIG